MWLVDRDTDGTGPRRVALPAIVRAALVRWYTGQGSRGDEEAGITLVQQARIGARWIACDCLPADTGPPILTPAFLSEAETYYLRRLTAAKRPEHHPECPFFRDQVKHRLTEVRNPDKSAEPPTGWFEVLKPAPEKLAQKPDEDASDTRTRQASVPRLARLLWRLLDVTGLNRCGFVSATPAEHSIIDEFRQLTGAASRLQVAPGIELGRVLWTHGTALHSRRAYAALRAISAQWPPGHAVQGFLILFATAFRGHEIEVAGCEPIRVHNRVQSPASLANPIEGPYLVIVVVGELPEVRGFAPLRAYAQPIYSGHRFVPIDTAFERRTLRGLLAAQHQLDRTGIDLGIERPIFDRLTSFGTWRPNFLLEAQSRLTGEVKQVAVEAIDPRDADHLASRKAASAQAHALMPVIEVTPEDIEAGRLDMLIPSVLAM